MSKRKHQIRFVADPAVPADQFVLRQAGEDVSGGTINMLPQLTQLFEWGSYDEVAVHPRVFALVPKDYLEP